MRRKELLKLGLITASALTITACGTKREVTKIDPLTQPIQEETEKVKPAEPILITVVPEVEVEDEDSNLEIDADIDYYGKEEATQPAPSTPNTGFPAVSNPSSDVDYSQGSPTAQITGNGVPYTDRSGHYHTGHTVITHGGGTW